MLKPYQYKRRSKARERSPKSRLEQINIQSDPIPLTGWVNGREASDIEERFARALKSFGLEFMFQLGVVTPHSPPERKKYVDFVVLSEGIFHPVEVDGQIGHRTSAQRGKDTIREILLNMTFVKWGYMPLIRVMWNELETQEMADVVVRRLFG
jgi:hypothetical protein